MLRGFTIFTTSEVPDVDYRFEGQSLPMHSRVLVVEDYRGNRVDIHGYGHDGPLGGAIERAVQQARKDLLEWNS